MPSQLEPALEERFGELLDQLRAGRVEPSEQLRERVRLLEPAQRRQGFRRRTLALAFAGALLVAAVIVGVVGRGGEKQTVLYATPNITRGGGGAKEDAGRSAQSAPLVGRLQDFRAQLTVKVGDSNDLPDATRQAMRIAQSLGGYVVSAQYGGGNTDSVMVLRVPIARAQEAIDRLTGLGEIAGQRYSLQDLQDTVDQLDAQADRLEERIAQLERELRSRGLSPRERANLRNRLEQAQRDLDNVLGQRDGTVAQARNAEITLMLTADRSAPAASDGVIGRAVGALKSVWEWVLAVLIVGVPFAVLLAAAFFLGRRLRLRANERLLGA